MSALHFISALCSCISLLCLLLALGTDYWVTDSSEHFGLWNVCEGKTCYPLGVERVPANLKAIRGFMLLGMIAGAVSFGGLCTMNCKPRLGNISMSLITYIASFTAALCVLFAMSIFSGKLHSSFYGWSSHFGWASFPLYLLTGYLTYKFHKSTATTA